MCGERVKRRWTSTVARGILGVAVAVIVLAEFVTPAAYEDQFRRYAHSAPDVLRLGTDQEGRWGVVFRRDESNQRLRLFAPSPPYRLLGLFEVETRLYGSSAGPPPFLLGTDALGRDHLTRLVYGARQSLVVGLVAASAAAGLGLVIGLLAGGLGGFCDRAITKLSEAFLVLPWLYLLLAVRSLLPLKAEPAMSLVILVAVLSLVGWPRTALLVRARTLTERSAGYVRAARGLGVRPLGVIARHLGPALFPLAVAQFFVLMPQFILAEVGLSFLGVGVTPPLPSWGSLLQEARDPAVLLSAWWLLLPAVALSVVLWALYFVRPQPSRNASRAIPAERG